MMDMGIARGGSRRGGGRAIAKFEIWPKIGGGGRTPPTPPLNPRMNALALADHSRTLSVSRWQTGTLRCYSFNLYGLDCVFVIARLIGRVAPKTIGPLPTGRLAPLRSGRLVPQVPSNLNTIDQQ